MFSNKNFLAKRVLIVYENENEYVIDFTDRKTIIHDLAMLKMKINKMQLNANCDLSRAELKRRMCLVARSKIDYFPLRVFKIIRRHSKLDCVLKIHNRVHRLVFKKKKSKLDKLRALNKELREKRQKKWQKR